MIKTKSKIERSFIMTEKQHKADILKKSKPPIQELHDMMKDIRTHAESDIDRLHRGAVEGEIPVKPYSEVQKWVRELFGEDTGYGCKTGVVTKDGYLINGNVERGGASADIGHGFEKVVEPMHITKDGTVYQFGDNKFFNKFKEAAKGSLDKKGYVNTTINSQNLIMLDSTDKKTGRNITRFMAGPGGAEIESHKMKAGDITGKYITDDKAYKELQRDFDYYWSKDAAGVTTYVDPRSEINCDKHIPKHSTFINSKLDTRLLDGTGYLANIHAKNSDLKFNNRSWIDDLQCNDVKMNKPQQNDFTLFDALQCNDDKMNKSQQSHITHTKLFDVNLGPNVALHKTEVTNATLENSNLDEAKLDGGTVKDNTKIKNSVIKQDPNSLIQNSNIQRTYLSNSDLQHVKPDNANIINNAHIANSVLKGKALWPLTLDNSNINYTLGINGLVASNSQIAGRQSRPVIIDNGLSNRNIVKPNHLLFKVYHELQKGKTMDDAEAIRKNMPAIKPNSNLTKALREFNHGHYSNIAHLAENIQASFVPENQLSGTQKRAIVVRDNPALKNDQALNDAVERDNKSRRKANSLVHSMDGVVFPVSHKGLFSVQANVGDKQKLTKDAVKKSKTSSISKLHPDNNFDPTDDL